MKIDMSWMLSNTRTKSRKNCFCCVESPLVENEIILAFENFSKNKIRFQKKFVGNNFRFPCFTKNKSHRKCMNIFSIGLARGTAFVKIDHTEKLLSLCSR